MSRQFYLIASLAVNCLLISFVLLNGPNLFTKTKYSDLFYASRTKNRPTLEFIPKRPVISCNDLFTDSVSKAFNLSTRFNQMIKRFHSEVNASTAGIRGPVLGYFDGHSFLLREQYKALHYIAGLKFVRTICETGFNYGHSSFNFLTANDEAVVHSFDYGRHPYTGHMANYLSKTFPGRFFIHYGDSSKTVPSFVQNNTDLRCDLIFIDSGHTYAVAKAELASFIKIAGVDNIIVMDDYPSKSGKKYGEAWEELLSQGIIEEIMRCKFSRMVFNNHESAFVIGSAIVDHK